METKTEARCAEFVRQELEESLKGMVSQATEIINRRISKKRDSLANPGYILINVQRAVNPLLGYTFPKGLREIAEERVLSQYRNNGWCVERYSFANFQPNGVLEELLSEIYKMGKYKFSLPERIM